MKQTLKIEINSKADKEKIENFLKKENLIYEWENSKKKLTREELIEKLRNPELEGTVIFMEDPTLPTGENWEDYYDTN